ncbi:PREDICTED: neurturin [Mandrillus leucophaeus]|uniref:neurturin n=1 Tax=Mandrillus leucophaeus TaxID=9568 RepID=UPI0005F5196F|nr:PREDICTED: neurturin [Mandrillus leucophaeus]
MQRWKAAALASVLCSSVLSIWMCREGLLLSHRLGPALVPLRRLPRTLDTRIARLAQYRALLQGAPDAVELRELTPWAGEGEGGATLGEETEVQVDPDLPYPTASSGRSSPTRCPFPGSARTSPRPPPPTGKAGGRRSETAPRENHPDIEEHPWPQAPGDLQLQLETLKEANEQDFQGALRTGLGGQAQARGWSAWEAVSGLPLAGVPAHPRSLLALRFEVVDSSTIWADSAWPPQRARSFQTLRKPK